MGALLEARAIKAASCQLSVDLGVSYQTAELYPEGFGLGGKKMVLWEAIEKLEDKSGVDALLHVIGMSISLPVLMNASGMKKCVFQEKIFLNFVFQL